MEIIEYLEEFREDTMYNGSFNWIPLAKLRTLLALDEPDEDE